MKRTLTLATASLALALSGCGGGDEEKSSAAPADTNTGTASEQAPPADGKKTALKISADPGGDLKFVETSLDAKAGEVTITMDNPSEIPHAVAIEGNGVDAEGQVVEKGEQSEATASLAAGSYEYYCPVPGHDAVMRGKLTVK